MVDVTMTVPEADAPRPRGPRLSAAARRSSILEAARRAFCETGAMNGTTMRTIADRAGISEGVIYRHFESKDQLFYEAVVTPLSEAVDALVAATHEVDRDEPLTAERQDETLQALYRQLIATFDEVMPLLGLVLFGDPQVAQRFYREHLTAAMDRLGAAWRQVARRHGTDIESADISARAVMGTVLILALEGHYPAQSFDRDRMIALTAEGTRHGFFPTLAAGSRQTSATG
jgi:AcrR family transcriptional regulator